MDRERTPQQDTSQQLSKGRGETGVYHGGNFARSRFNGRAEHDLDHLLSGAATRIIAKPRRLLNARLFRVWVPAVSFGRLAGDTLKRADEVEPAAESAFHPDRFNFEFPIYQQLLGVFHPQVGSTRPASCARGVSESSLALCATRLPGSARSAASRAVRGNDPAESAKSARYRRRPAQSRRSSGGR